MEPVQGGRTSASYSAVGGGGGLKTHFHTRARFFNEVSSIGFPFSYEKGFLFLVLELTLIYFTSSVSFRVEVVSQKKFSYENCRKFHALQQGHLLSVQIGEKSEKPPTCPNFAPFFY